MTSAELLSLCQLLSGRPATDQMMTDARWYELLTLGQKYWFKVLATNYPEVLYGPPVELQTDDGGQTYRLPLVGGVQVLPVGLAEVRAGRNGRVLRLGAEWEDAELTAEGTLLRVPHGKTRSFGAGLWIRCATPPGVVSAAAQPTLKPVEAHELIAYHALYLWARRPPQVADPEGFRALEQQFWSGDPNIPGDYGLEGMLSTQFLHQGSSVAEDDGAWWHSEDFR